MSSWQRMETAPLDGTEVDLWTNFGRITGCAFTHHHWLNGAPVGEMGWFDERFDGGMPPVPTHWMLPPAPPEDV
ncbi:hypothetical protein IAE29_21710 [Ochrobactrum sp. S46]|uniref:hypothetical protein n=1 Tax=Brucella pseudogrignonensis TaxID=419475 RepID=UPI000DD8D314|nr:hypothetical protein [Ochrobactrum sp. S45]MBK0045953.1 hypothetical protein [Ochrobactrum sp. S46]